jgi:UDP-N-acetylglucosamine 1-carboxyvinyltransferase
MDSFVIKGGVPLKGEVTISGAKNSVLPILAATLLTGSECRIRRVPNLTDVRFMGEILENLGAKVRFHGDSVTVRAEKVKGVGDYELVRKMRGSICIMGPLLGRLRTAVVSLPAAVLSGRAR